VSLVVVPRGSALTLKSSSVLENLQGILMPVAEKRKVWGWEVPDLSWLLPVVESGRPEI
jgi:hypothetical protein